MAGTPPFRRKQNCTCVRNTIGFSRFLPKEKNH